MGYSLWGRKELDTTERLHFFLFHVSIPILSYCVQAVSALATGAGEEAKVGLAPAFLPRVLSGRFICSVCELRDFLAG